MRVFNVLQQLLWAKTNFCNWNKKQKQQQQQTNKHTHTHKTHTKPYFSFGQWFAAIFFLFLLSLWYHSSNEILIYFLNSEKMKLIWCWLWNIQVYLFTVYIAWMWRYCKVNLSNKNEILQCMYLFNISVYWNTNWKKFTESILKCIWHALLA